MSDVDAPLPDLQDAILDRGTLDRLVTDLTLVATDVTVRLKEGAAVLTGEESVSLAEGVGALRDGRVLGIQVRYRHAGDSWCDTLLRVGDAVRLVRIRLTDG